MYNAGISSWGDAQRPATNNVLESSMTNEARVFLIGGAPGVGKTTLGRALGARLGISSVSIDDLMTVAQTVTTRETHPGLHAMRRVPSRKYFTDSTLDTLQRDADAQHAACWPFVEAVVVKHATWDPSSIVIDGWYLRPERVATLELDSVSACWIVASPSVIEARERANTAWLEGSADPARMLENFIARSLWFNQRIGDEARALGMRVLLQPGDVPVDELCRQVLSG